MPKSWCLRGPSLPTEIKSKCLAFPSRRPRLSCAFFSWNDENYPHWTPYTHAKIIWVRHLGATSATPFPAKAQSTRQRAAGTSKVAFPQHFSHFLLQFQGSNATLQKVVSQSLACLSPLVTLHSTHGYQANMSTGCNGLIWYNCNGLIAYHALKPSSLLVSSKAIPFSWVDSTC